MLNKLNINPIVVSSINAGLGALTFRNHYRALKEQAQGSKLKTTGKIGAGLGAAGAAGAGGLYAAGRKSIKSAQKKYDEHPIWYGFTGKKRPEDQGIVGTIKTGVGVVKDKYNKSINITKDNSVKNNNLHQSTRDTLKNNKSHQSTRDTLKDNSVKNDDPYQSTRDTLKGIANKKDPNITLRTHLKKLAKPEPKDESFWDKITNMFD